jgi:plastocyanin
MGGRRQLVAAVVIGVLATVGLAACGDGDDEAGGDVERSGLVADDMLRFDPDEFEIELNEEVDFQFVNEDDDRQHNFTISSVFVDEDTALSVDVAPGGETEVRFTVREQPRDGFLTFYCRFHQSEGMAGRIRVR